MVHPQAQKGKVSRPLLSPLWQCLWRARECGEAVEGFHLACPVTEQPDPHNLGQMLRVHEPLSFKTLKELKTATATYGPTTPFVLSLLESLGTDVLTPRDWQTLAKACLNPGDYLLWKTEWFDQRASQAQGNQAHGVGITQDILLRSGHYAVLQNQLTYNLQACQQINICATKA